MTPLLVLIPKMVLKYIPANALAHYKESDQLKNSSSKKKISFNFWATAKIIK